MRWKCDQLRTTSLRTTEASVHKCNGDKSVHDLTLPLGLGLLCAQADSGMHHCIKISGATLTSVRMPLMPFSIVKRNVKVSPPITYISSFRLSSPIQSNPYAVAAAVDSSTIHNTFRLAIGPRIFHCLALRIFELRRHHHDRA